MAHILVIDDNAIMAQTLQRILEAQKHLVVTAENGREGMRIVRTTPIDVVVTDLVMPEKEGIETIIELRKTHPQIKIVAMSGGPDIRAAANNLRAARHLGAAVSLEKPFTSEELTDAISQAIAQGPAGPGANVTQTDNTKSSGR